MATSTAAVDTTPVQSTETMEKQVSTELKIKIMTLAAEGRIIRQQERKFLKWARSLESKTEETVQTEGSVRPVLPADRQETMVMRAIKARASFNSLREHRVNVVRRAARHNCLAYGFLRGRAYSQLEQKRYTAPDWKKVEEVVKRFCNGDVRDVMQRFSEWKDAAELHAATVHAE